MPKESEINELNDEELERVSGGSGYTGNCGQICGYAQCPNFDIDKEECLSCPGCPFQNIKPNRWVN